MPRPRGLTLREVPAPSRLAPYAAALSVRTLDTVGPTTPSTSAPALPLVTSDLVILHDPDGQPGWDGDLRLVLRARARLDHEQAGDPALAQAAWSWLSEALETAGAGYRRLLGTVTTLASQTFGGLELSDACAHAEVHASWTPVSSDLGPHLAAWYTLVHVAAGHEPEAATVLTVAGR